MGRKGLLQSASMFIIGAKMISIFDNMFFFKIAFIFHFYTLFEHSMYVC